MSVVRGLRAWRPLMRQRLTLAAPTGVDGYNATTYGTAVPYRCRLVGKRRVVRNAMGVEVVSSMTAYLYTNDVVNPLSKVTLSTADVGSTEVIAVSPPILAVGRFPDENGNAHSVLYL